MAKERMHNLKQTSSYFQCRGIVSRTESSKFYRDGIGANKDGISVDFGIKINNDKEIFVTLTGFPRKEVYYFKRGENGAKGTTKTVEWKNRYKSPGEGYSLIGVKISTDKDDDGNNVNTTFTEYDAVEHLKKNLRDGDSVFIKGNIEFRSWTDRNGQVVKRVNLIPDQISYMKNPIDFESDDYKEMCEFENTIVFQSIDKEEDENGKSTGRFVLTGWSVGYNSVENVSFIIDKEDEKVASAIRKNMKVGNSIKTYGYISVKNNIEASDVEDDGWGSTKTSPMERRVSAPTVREYIVYKVDGSTFDTETYSEDDIMEAVRKIKAAKTASENFGETSKANNDVDDWDSDDDFSENDPW